MSSKFRCLFRAIVYTAICFLPVAMFGGSQSVKAQVLTWTKQGPAPSTDTNIENVPDNEVVGAIHDVAPHPTNSNIVYVGTVNGGIWRTENAQDKNPTWTNLTDGISLQSGASLSISALEFDPTDVTHQTLIAGIGRVSSYLRVGGTGVGPLRTSDGGKSRTTTDPSGTVKQLDISGVAARGRILVLAARNRPSDWVDQGELTSPAPPSGIWRSSDGGQNWVRISGGAGSNLPEGEAFDLVADPRNINRLFTNAGTSGIYRSDDTGLTWTKISNAIINGLLSTGVRNIEFAIGNAANVYMAVVGATGRLNGLFRSPDGGNSWTELDLPGTKSANGIFVGIHPGKQGAIHLSMVADPSNHNLVYVGGDRQPDRPEETQQNVPQFPNSLGAQSYSGRLFVVDASKQTASQTSAITHGKTKNNSSPHPDSRDMAMSVDGHILEVNDGGIYRRTLPRVNDQPKIDEGDWISLNGNLMNTEFHNGAWDSVFDVAVGPAQDNGVPYQQITGSPRWRGVLSGDGGVVAVDDTSLPNVSILYASAQHLGQFRRIVRNAAANTLQITIPQLLILPNLDPNDTFRKQSQFYTPVRLNRVKPTRIVLAGMNGVYESLDQANTLLRVGPDIFVPFERGTANLLSYGASDNQDALYVGAGSQLFARLTAYPEQLRLVTTYPGIRSIRGVVCDANNSRRVFVVDAQQVFQSNDGGTTWGEITDNLGTLRPGRIRSIAFLSRVTSAQGGAPAAAVAVGTDTGVYVRRVAPQASWSQLGQGLPPAKVLALDYDEIDEILLAATMGRGIWTLPLTEAAAVSESPASPAPSFPIPVPVPSDQGSRR
jgi:photosystem II stability/assembly factor-like uncharacterized protein